MFKPKSTKEKLKTMSESHLQTIYLDEEQHARLRQLSIRTNTPLAEYVRQAIDLIIARAKEKQVIK